MSRVVLDTSTIAEYVDLAGPLHEEAAAVFAEIRAGRLGAIIPHVTLAETYYVAARIYARRGLTRPEARAAKLIQWLYRSPHISLAEPSLELALLAGRIKRAFGLALTDAYVLAAAKLHHAKALFRRRERDMVAREREIAREYEVVFLHGE